MAPTTLSLDFKFILITNFFLKFQFEYMEKKIQ